ncbi:MAG TPA: ATP-binding protein [Candidatus Saccharimonadales bacterium]|nr:ATP-binding protein [Candidatus Saccharimonadales bacterium]
MLDSIRVRLTLWYTLILGLALISLTGFSYFLYGRSLMQRTDSAIVELSSAFATTFHAELADSFGPDAPRNAAREAMLEHRFRDTLFVVLDSNGNVLASSFDLPSTENLRMDRRSDFLSSASFRDFAAVHQPDPTALRTLPGTRGGFRASARSMVTPAGNYTLVVLQSLHPQKELLGDIRHTFYWVIPAALLLACVGGYFLARQSLAPVAAMAAQAGSMGVANLHDRLMVKNSRDELGQLAVAFNQLLERLEASFETQRRFVADASHELRTPVAILRGEAEVTLSKDDRSPAEYRDTLAVLRDESQRLAHIVEDLFTLTRADAGQYPLSLRDAYLDELAGQALVRARSLATAKNITLNPSLEPDLPIHADEALLGRMLLNLLDNAIKYSPANTTVELACRREGDSYAIRIADQGHGIPPELQSRIFERFFRADKSRSRAETERGGAGLGLSIARWIAEAHHGRLELTRSDSTGSLFTVTLPAPAKPVGAAAG